MMSDDLWTRAELIELHNSFDDPKDDDHYDERYAEDVEVCHTCLGSGIYMTPNTSASAHMFDIFPCTLCDSFACRSENEAAVIWVETKRLCDFLRQHKWKYVWTKVDKLIFAHKDGERFPLPSAVVRMGFDIHWEENPHAIIALNQFYDLAEVERAIFAKD